MTRSLEVDGMKLRELREERALSQRDLSARCGVAPDTIGQIERGARKAQHKTIRKLAEALDIEPRQLMRDVAEDA